MKLKITVFLSKHRIKIIVNVSDHFNGNYYNSIIYNFLQVEIDHLLILVDMIN